MLHPSANQFLSLLLESSLQPCEDDCAYSQFGLIDAWLHPLMGTLFYLRTKPETIFWREHHFPKQCCRSLA